MKKKYTTIEDIAKLTGKSITTISRVLNNRNNDGILISEKTREIVLQVAKDLNYVPNFAAKTLSQKNSMTIGLIVPDITQSYFSQLCYFLTREAESNNYNIVLSHSYEDAHAEKKALEMLVSRRVDGIIIAPSMGEDNIEYIERIQSQHIPIILVDRYFKNSNKFTSVTTDDIQGSYDLVKHIIEKRAKRIAFIMGNINTSVSLERLEGYKKALKEANIKFEDDLVIQSSYFEEDGYNITNNLIKSGKINNIDAIMGINDPVSLGIYESLEENNIRIPDDIMLTGYGNNKFTRYFKVPITTIDQMIKNIAKTTCEKLIDMINGNNLSQESIKIPCALIKRKSTND